MADINGNNVNGSERFRLEVNKEQTETLARRLLPEIKKFFADEDIRKEFKEWKKTQKDDKRK